MEEEGDDSDDDMCMSRLNFTFFLLQSLWSFSVSFLLSFVVCLFSLSFPVWNNITPITFSRPNLREALTAPSQQLLSWEGHYRTWEKGGLENGIGIKSGEKCASQDGGYGITSLLFPFLFSLPFPPTPTVVALPFNISFKFHFFPYPWLLLLSPCLTSLTLVASRVTLSSTGEPKEERRLLTTNYWASQRTEYY